MKYGIIITTGNVLKFGDEVEVLRDVGKNFRVRSLRTRDIFIVPKKAVHLIGSSFIAEVVLTGSEVRKAARILSNKAHCKVKIQQIPGSIGPTTKIFAYSIDVAGAVLVEDITAHECL